MILMLRPSRTSPPQGPCPTLTQCPDGAQVGVRRRAGTGFRSRMRCGLMDALERLPETMSPTGAGGPQAGLLIRAGRAGAASADRANLAGCGARQVRREEQHEPDARKEYAVLQEVGDLPSEVAESGVLEVDDAATLRRSDEVVQVAVAVREDRGVEEVADSVRASDGVKRRGPARVEPRAGAGVRRRRPPSRIRTMAYGSRSPVGAAAHTGNRRAYRTRRNRNGQARTSRVRKRP